MMILLINVIALVIFAIITTVLLLKDTGKPRQKQDSRQKDSHQPDTRQKDTKRDDNESKQIVSLKNEIAHLRSQLKEAQARHSDMERSLAQAQILAQATKEAGDRELLTERERDILRLAQRGFPNPQIAQALHISAGTVRNHLSAIYRKLGVHSRYEALAIAKERGLIQEEH